MKPEIRAAVLAIRNMYLNGSLAEAEEADIGLEAALTAAGYVPADASDPIEQIALSDPFVTVVLVSGIRLIFSTVDQ